jgi:hypothetical protein
VSPPSPPAPSSAPHRTSIKGLPCRLHCLFSPLFLPSRARRGHLHDPLYFLSATGHRSVAAATKLKPPKPLRPLHGEPPLRPSLSTIVNPSSLLVAPSCYRISPSSPPPTRAITGAGTPSLCRRQVASPSTCLISELLPPRTCPTLSPCPTGAVATAAATPRCPAHRQRPHHRTCSARGDHESALSR